MPVDSDGVFTKKTTSEIIADFRRELRSQFGAKLDLNVGSPALKLTEAMAAQPVAEIQNTLDDVYRQMFPGTARGQALDDALELFGTRKQAARSEGTVHLNVNEIFTTPNPLAAAGELYFVGTSGRRYNLIEDILPPSTAFASNEGGTQSETIDATTTRIAQKLVLENATFVQAVRALVTHGGTAPVLDVTIETDNTDEPSGTLAASDLSLTGATPANGTDHDFIFTKGAVLQAGTYWIVFTRTAGSCTFDGGAGGDADQVSVYGGSWSASANVENLNIDLYKGGEAKVRADLPGATGNAEAGSLLNVVGVVTQALNDFNSKVDSFENLIDLAGGQDKESDTVYLDRVRRSVANRETSSLDGIVLTVRNVTGVRGATGVENTTLVGSSRDKVFDSDETGVTSEAIDGTPSRIAQKMVTADRRFVQHFNVKANHVSGTPTYTVRLETDNAGDPSGTLAFTGAQTTGFQPDNGSITAGVFDDGEFLEAGTYWLVLEQTSGSATFDGGAGGTADQVKVYSGSWSLSTNIENMNTELIGGVPPKGFRVFVSGGNADDIAQAIHDIKPVGILEDGLVTGQAENILGDTLTVRFDRPEEVDVVVKVTVRKTASFVGDADTIRDAIVAYVGGKDTKGATQEGLGVADELVRLGIAEAILDDVPGAFDLSVLQLGRKSSYPTPASLGGGQEVNLTATASEEFIISDVANDIAVTLEDA